MHSPTTVAAAATPDKRPASPGRRVLARLFRRFADVPLRSLAVFGVLLLGTALDVVSPLLLGRTLDSARAAAGRAESIDRTFGLPTEYVLLVALIAAVFLARAGMQFVSMVVTQSLGQRLENRLRTELFTKVTRLHFRYHDKNRSGATIARSLRDMEKAKRFFREVGFGYAEITLIATGSLVAATWVHWQYGVAILCVMTIAVVSTLHVGRTIAVRDRVVSDQYDEVTTVLQENVAGARVVRAFGRETDEIGKFGGRLRAMTNGWRSLARYWTGRMPFVGCAYHLSSGLVLLVGVYRIRAGEGGFGEVAGVLFLVNLMRSRMRVLTRMVILGQEAVASATRVFEVLDHEEEVRAPAQPHAPPDGPGELRFENVHFAHRADTPVLQGVDLVVPAGSTLGILGPTGAGKSTLAALLPRYYDPTQGRVLLDGTDLREFDPADLRRAIGLVFQESFLFSATVRRNIAYGRPGATDEETEQAARLAAAHDFVSALPLGYETVVGERGVSLSGGQRQRLTIARALAMHPRVLVFDDATAAVDAVTEKRLFRGIRAAAKGRTTIVISQRVTSVRWCDRIAVLEDGRISAVGTHDDLVSSSALYAEVAEHQSLAAGTTGTGGAS